MAQGRKVKNMAQDNPRVFSKSGYTFTLSVLLLAATIISLAIYSIEWRRISQSQPAVLSNPLDAIFLEDLVSADVSYLHGGKAEINRNSTHVILKVASNFPYRKEGFQPTDLSEYASMFPSLLSSKIPYEVIFASYPVSSSNQNGITFPDSGAAYFENNGTNGADAITFRHPSGWKLTDVSASVFCNKSNSYAPSDIVVQGGSGPISHNIFYNDSAGILAYKTGSSSENTAVSWSVLFKDGSNLSVVTNLSESENVTRVSYTKSPGAVLVMPFDDPVTTSAVGAVKDYSAYANNGTLGNGSAESVPDWGGGKSGGAYLFSYDNDGKKLNNTFINVPAPASGSLDFPTSDFSVSVWVNPEDPPNYYPFAIVNKRNKGTENGWGLLMILKNAQKLNYSFQLGNGVEDNAPCTVLAYENATASVKFGAWQHLVATVKRTGNFIFYVNGQPKFTKDISSKSSCLAGNSDNLTIGSPYMKKDYGFSDTYSFPGAIDEVRIYNRVLSQDEITNIYNKRYQDKCSVNLTFAYELNSIGAKKITAYYNTNANLTIRTIAPDAAMLLPFDTNVSSTVAGAVWDYSGNNIPATLGSIGGSTQAPTWTPSGWFGGGYIFDGLNDTIGLGANTLGRNLNGTSGVTFSAWANPRKYSSASQIVGVVLGFNQGEGIDARFDSNGKLVVAGRSTLEDSLQSATSSASVPLNSWTHVSGVYDFSNDRIYMYLNGTLDSSATVAFGLNYYNHSWGGLVGDDRLGDFVGKNRYFNGTLDEVRVFKRALSAEEINALYRDAARVRSGQLVASID